MKFKFVSFVLAATISVVPLVSVSANPRFDDIRRNCRAFEMNELSVGEAEKLLFELTQVLCDEGFYRIPDYSSLPKAGIELMIKRLLDAGVDVNIPHLDESLTRLGVLAFASGNVELFRLFLSFGWDKFSGERTCGGTLLHVAAQKGLLFDLQGFLEEGFNVNSQDFYGRTPLHNALIRRDKKMVDFLMVSGADSGIKNVYGVTPYDLNEWLGGFF
jgi:hypothetical protein